VKFRQGTDGRVITGYKSMVGSIACGECELGDALHCGTDDNVEELGGAGLAISATNSCCTRSRVTSASASRRRRVAGRLGHRSRLGLALTVPSWPIGAGV
jgi:hypothetical protein